MSGLLASVWNTVRESFGSTPVKETGRAAERRRRHHSAGRRGSSRSSAKLASPKQPSRRKGGASDAAKAHGKNRAMERRSAPAGMQTVASGKGASNAGHGSKTAPLPTRRPGELNLTPGRTFRRASRGAPAPPSAAAAAAASTPSKKKGWLAALFPRYSDPTPVVENSASQKFAAKRHSDRGAGTGSGAGSASNLRKTHSYHGAAGTGQRGKNPARARGRSLNLPAPTKGSAAAKQRRNGMQKSASMSAITEVTVRPGLFAIPVGGASVPGMENIEKRGFARKYKVTTSVPDFIKPGAKVRAIWSFDGRWYMAKVLAKMPNDSFLVYFPEHDERGEVGLGAIAPAK